MLLWCVFEYFKVEVGVFIFIFYFYASNLFFSWAYASSTHLQDQYRQSFQYFLAIITKPILLRIPLPNPLFFWIQNLYPNSPIILTKSKKPAKRNSDASFLIHSFHKILKVSSLISMVFLTNAPTKHPISDHLLLENLQFVLSAHLGRLMITHLFR